MKKTKWYYFLVWIPHDWDITIWLSSEVASKLGAIIVQNDHISASLPRVKSKGTMLSPTIKVGLNIVLES